jgi:hypothetical protein
LEENQINMYTPTEDKNPCEEAKRERRQRIKYNQLIDCIVYLAKTYGFTGPVKDWPEGRIKGKALKLEDEAKKLEL